MVDKHTLHKDLTGNNLHQPFKTGADDEKPISPEIGDWYFAVNADKLYGCVEDGVWKSIALTTTSGDPQYQTDGNQGGIEPLVVEVSSVTIGFDVPFSDESYVVTLGLEYTGDELPSVYAMIVTDKTADGFTVLFSGEMDSDRYKLNWTAAKEK